MRLRQKAPDVAQAAGLIEDVHHLTVAAEHLAALQADALAAKQQLTGTHHIGIGRVVQQAVRDGLGQQIYKQRRDVDAAAAVPRKQAQVIGLQGAGGQQAIAKAQEQRVAVTGIGILHGLAGTSHVFGILPMLALPNHSLAISYIGGFAAGTIISRNPPTKNGEVSSASTAACSGGSA